MQISFLIGNGFDLNLNMKTSFHDFLQYYLKKENDSLNVLNLKNFIIQDIKEWSDLELALGKYTENIKSETDLDEILDDMIVSLSEYLKMEQEIIRSLRFDVNKFISNLIMPELVLEARDKIEIERHKSIWKDSKWRLNIVSLNYTDTIEFLLDNRGSDGVIGSNGFSQDVKFGEVIHLHGNLRKKMILGVNDVTQIDNIEFKNNDFIKHSFIKEFSNFASRDDVDSLCSDIFANSNLICVFGSSLGVTDKKWWKHISNCILNNECYLIVFWYSENQSNELRNYKFNYLVDDKIKAKLLELSDIDSSLSEKYFKKIIVATNTRLFKNLIIENY